MSHCVPDFHEVREAAACSSRTKKAAAGEEEIMELLWENGQVVVQPQKSSKKSPPNAAVEAAAEPNLRSRGEDEMTPHHLFMQEDEMASWLHYPIDDSSFDRDLYADLLYSAPPPPPPSAAIAPSVRLPNFLHNTRVPTRGKIESGPLISTVRKSTVVESRNDTPTVLATESRLSLSPSRSVDSFSGSAEPMQTPENALTAAATATAAAADDRKRKGREDNNNDSRTEDTEYQASEAKKQARGSASTKRSRAAEVHNLSERRRRDRINEKMKALQELIPRCNKSDKASMLDEAIEYLKSLQMQVQMMSMGCGMIPMMYPGVQQYMPAMGMGMGMGMGMNRPMMQYPPSMVPGSQNPATAAYMGPRFPMPPFHMPQVPVHDMLRIQASNQTEHTLNSHGTQNPNQNQTRMPNFVDPYHQFLGLHQAQLQSTQNQPGGGQPSMKQPSSSKENGNLENN